jgi:hypothetical protein
MPHVYRYGSIKLYDIFLDHGITAILVSNSMPIISKEPTILVSTHSDCSCLKIPYNTPKKRPP